MTRILAIGMTFQTTNTTLCFCGLKLSVALKVTDFLCSLGHGWEVTGKVEGRNTLIARVPQGPELEAGLVEISVPTGEKC